MLKEGPLDGVQVVECALWQAGPVAASILGELGAQVIKVEHPAGGDPTRGLETIVGMPATIAGGSTYVFEQCNRNTRSITLDLTKDRARNILHQLVGKADVFMHNFRPQAVTKLGLDYAALSRVNPKLIYASATGYGKHGPDRDSPAIDLTAMARSGWMAHVGERDDPPLIAGNGVTDQITGIMLSHGIVAALYAREKMGIGQEVDTSLLGSAIFLQANMINGTMLLGRELNRPLRSKAANPLWNYYQCGDNKWICLGMLQSERYWEDFCEAIGRPELLSDARFKTMKDRRSNCEELIRILDSVFATKPRDAWCKVFQQRRFIFAPIQNHLDLPQDPQVIENKYIVDFDHPNLGKIRTFGFPVEFSKTPAIIRSAAPTLGQHTEEILLELGYTWEGIGELRDTGVI